jgi:fatty acid desaturase
MLCSARGLRGLECLVHDASHYNCFRLDAKHRSLSDAIMNQSAAYFVFSTVQTYRISHLRHHRFLGEAEDPDRHRHLDLDFASIRNGPIWSTLIAVIRRGPRYITGWWATIGTDGAIVVRCLIQHAAVIATAAAFLGASSGLLYWTLAFLIPFLGVLPIFRMIGEAGEHDYDQHPCETRTNAGCLKRLLIHPHNDGLHELHHMFPNVPHARLPELTNCIEHLPVQLTSTQ